jgi:hypothetical protein
MKFVVKDLMISVLPLRGQGPFAGGCECSHCSGACTNPCASAGACGSQTKGFDWVSQVFDPPYLADLKQQLKDALVLVEAREKAVLESMRPQSAAEVELLRAHLTEALEELKQPQPFEAAAKQGKPSNKA